MAAHSCARPFRLFHITSEVKLHFTELLFPQQECRRDEVDRDRRQHGDVIGADAVGHRLGAVQAADEHGRDVHRGVDALKKVLHNS